jgi:hypothetical protein
MSQADNAAPNSIAIDGFTGSFVALAPRNDSNGKQHKSVMPRRNGAFPAVAFG